MSKKILVVEDEKNIAELERDYLEANGYTVEIEFDGKNGLDKAIGSDYDLVILDVMLPGIDGFEVCRQIRKHKECPVLMVSAKKDEIDKIRGLGLGADDYITKPFNILELKARIRALLRRAGTAKKRTPEQTLVCGHITLDRSSRSAFREDVPVDLTAKEFDLMELLMRNPNRVYSRETLLDAIWGYDVSSEIRTVDVHIRHIRQKLGDDAHYIETIRGVGYKFNDRQENRL